jgi:predicted  nucleic acid-binding Zn-ribbon protein
MKEVLNAMVQAVGDQAIALGTVDDRIAALKRTLARQFPDIAEELKGQIETEQEQSRKDNYELQVSLARLREAISELPEAGVKVERKRRAAKTPTTAAGNRTRSR